jgi:hypothetical protein
MTFVKLLLFAIGIFNVMICLWIGCAAFFNLVRFYNLKKPQTTEDRTAPSIEDSLG